jgi:hypothetical protein
VYDSVFIVENPIFEKIDFRSEFTLSTLFLPSNQVFDDCYRKLGEQLVAMGKPFGKSDSLMAFNWIKGAIFHNQLIDNYNSKENWVSVDQKVWKTSVQQVNEDGLTMSNGKVFFVTKLKIPNNVFLTRIKSLVHYYEYLPEEVRPNLIQFLNNKTAIPKATDGYNFSSSGGPTGSYKILYTDGDIADGLPLTVEFAALKIQTMPDNTILASEMLIPPGEYRLYMGFQEKNHPYVNVYFNGNLVMKDLYPSPATPWNYDRTDVIINKSRIWDGTGGLVGIVTVPGTEMASIRIKVEFNRLSVGTIEELKIYHWLLVPTENNY